MSCRSTINAQEKNSDTVTKEKVNNEKPKFSEKDIYNKINPNTIELFGEIIGIERNVTICDKSYKTILVIKTKQILNVGTGVINALAKETIYRIVIPDMLPLKNKSPQIGDLYEILVIEQLCKDTSKTIYFVSQYLKQ